jgi:hypothetical protein
VKVSVGVNVSVGVEVIVGPNICPELQPEMSRLKDTTNMEVALILKFIVLLRYIEWIKYRLVNTLYKIRMWVL